MEKYILAIDQGTTSSRAILFNKNKELVYVAQKEFTQIFRKPGFVEHDANEIYLSVIYCIEKVIFDNDIKMEQIESVSITNQRETTVLWDKRTGRPVCNAIVWQSRQSLDICEKLKREGLEEMLRDKTGLIIDPYFSATKILYALEEHPSLRKLMDEGNLMFGTIDSWLVYKLTGNHYTDHTNASRTLLYDIFKLEWSHEILDRLEINENILPKVLDSSADYGRITVSPFSDYDIHINGVIGDQQAALYGQECINKGDIKITYGTGLFLLTNTGDIACKSNSGLLTTIAYSLDGKVKYALEGSVFVAGSLIQWLRDGLKFFRNAKDSEDFARSCDTSEGVYVVPAFTGLGAPYWDGECKGAILGLTRGTSRRHITRASLEAICYQAKDIINSMEADSGAITKLKVDGGASANNLLMQFQADILNKHVLRPRLVETTALGSAMMASLRTNFFNEESLDIEKEFVPNMDDKTRDKLYEGWINAVKSTRTFKE